MSETNGHERMEPTKEQLELAIDQVRKGKENLKKTVEGQGQRVLKERDADALIQALVDIPVLSEIPANEAELEEWEKKNPEKAKQYREAVNRILQEFEP